MHPVFLALFLMLASFADAVAAAGSVVVTARTLVYDRSDPSFCLNCRSYKLVEVADGKRLGSLDGAGPPDAFADYLADGSPEEQALAKVVSGGLLRLAYSPVQGRLLATVTYDAVRVLTQDELAILTEYTRGQLLDGIGEGFTQNGTGKQKLWVEFDVLDQKNISAIQKSP